MESREDSHLSTIPLNTHNLPSYQHPDTLFVTINQPSLTHHNHPTAIVFIRVHSWCLTCHAVLLSLSANSLQPPWTVAHQASLSMGILQARILEWVAMPFSRRSSQPRDWTWVSYMQAVSLPTEPPGKPCPNLVLGVLTEPYTASVVSSSVGKSVSCFH